MYAPIHSPTARFELRFHSLIRQDNALCFPCNSHRRFDLCGATERARNSYFFARALVGRDYAAPEVRSLQ